MTTLTPIEALALLKVLADADAERTLCGAAGNDIASYNRGLKKLREIAPVWKKESPAKVFGAVDKANAEATPCPDCGKLASEKKCGLDPRYIKPRPKIPCPMREAWFK